MSWQAMCREEAYGGNDYQPIGPLFGDREDAQGFADSHSEDTGHHTTAVKVDD